MYVLFIAISTFNVTVSIRTGFTWTGWPQSKLVRLNFWQIISGGPIGVGPLSTLGGKTFLPEKYALKINKMPEFYTILSENARILHNDCSKIFFPDFLGEGEGQVPPVPSYAYGWTLLIKTYTTTVTIMPGGIGIGGVCLFVCLFVCLVSSFVRSFVTLVVISRNVAYYKVRFLVHLFWPLNPNFLASLTSGVQRQPRRHKMHHRNSRGG